LPSATRRRRGWLFYTSIFLGLLVVAGGITTYVVLKPAPARADVLFHTVKRESLDVTVSEKGTLESANNIDIICKVKAGSKGGGGSGFATSINWVIDDGSRVKKGQVLMLLDDSALQDQARDERIKVDQAYAAKVSAEKQYEITVNGNAKLIADAQNKLILAQLDLEKLIGLSYDPDDAAVAAVAGVPGALSEGGDYRRQIDDANGKVRLAESDVEQSLERSAWADRMVKMKYMSPAQAQAERSKLQSNQENLRSLRTLRSLLAVYDRKKMITDFRSKVEGAQQELNQAKLTADAQEIQADIGATGRKTQAAIYNQEREKLKDIEDQIKECRIESPQDGMVVYFKNESNRFNNSQQGLIEQGAQVKEGQKLLRIPNLERMQVNTKVHEAMVARIRADERIATNFVEELDIGLLSTADPFSRLLTRKEDVQKWIRDRFHNKEYTIKTPGQEATIKVDAMQNVNLRGRVKTVARVASQADSWISDVKLYPTIVIIEDPVEGLNPDMSAEVTIHIRGIKDVLTIPLQAVVGGSELGLKRKVFVKTATGYDEKEVTLGIYNDKVIEVREGLNEGDEVVINPKVLLGDSKQKTRDGAAPANEGKGGGKGGKGKAKSGDGSPDIGSIPGEEKKGGWDPTKKRGGKGGFKGGGGGGAPPPQG